MTVSDRVARITWVGVFGLLSGVWCAMRGALDTDVPTWNGPGVGRAEDRVSAALLQHGPLPDYSDTDTRELLDRLAEKMADRTEDARECIALVGALRARKVEFDLIADVGAVPRGTAHRWSRIFLSSSRGKQSLACEGGHED